MPRSRAKRGDLHGNAPDDSRVALLIIDMINAFDFDGAEGMLPRALAAARAIAELKRRARGVGVAVVYVNDNFGRWRSDFHQILEHCLESPGREIARLLTPEKEDRGSPAISACCSPHTKSDDRYASRTWRR